MVSHYGDGVNLAGHCIEASELIVDILKVIGFEDVETVEGWVKYDDHKYSEYAYDAHTWVELIDNNQMYYIDVTAEQFNYGMDIENKYPPVLISEGLPYGVVYNIPEDGE